MENFSMESREGILTPIFCILRLKILAAAAHITERLMQVQIVVVRINYTAGNVGAVICRALQIG